jgi:acyl carrier protein phosphodiesterase
MNFLAHSLIPELAAAQSEPHLIAGGFLGDFIKGPVPADLPPVLTAGIRLHRRIDAYSNGQPDIRASCARFPDGLRRFAPVFVDVIADHLLACRWARFSSVPLTAFTADVYRAIETHAELLPEHGRRFFEYMATEDLLAAYADVDVMLRSLRSVTRRLRRESLEPALVVTVTRELPNLEADFLSYFPDIVAHAQAWLAAELPSAASTKQTHG